MQSTLLLGAHVSVAGGVGNGPAEGLKLGCTVIQIFTKNQRQWAGKPLESLEIDRYFTELKKTEIRSATSHASYLINLAAPDTEILKKSRAAMADELLRAHALKLDGVVVHPGAHLGQKEAWGVRKVAESVNDILSRTPEGRSRLLLEATAGQGSTLAYKFEHLRYILAAVKAPERCGVCLDTCHLFAAGYDLRTRKAYEKTVSEIDRVLGLGTIRCIHLNDSKFDFGTKRDRHAHIGKGFIGKEAFRLILNDPRFAQVPKILETPEDEVGGYAWDLKVLRKLVR
jgi:deoxyribonuclease-4